ncbi:hypothetical protein L2E82_21480 [Cichorium intybus]|uniref:Uncharacterized protein n=1 Tax=Cichorium intybus TaxID=13427 RepID=A0ACB9DW68_CICIN|nr:hypothetical protein L2E82_21480 [Cichorium intybus]
MRVSVFCDCDPLFSQEAERDRAKKFIKEKRWYEAQRDMLQNQALKLDRHIFASEGIKDAQKTVSDLKKLNGMMKNLQDDMVGLIDGSNEIVESLGGSHKAPDHDIDEQDLMNGNFESNAYNAELEESEFVGDSYLQPKNDEEPYLREPRVVDRATEIAYQGRTFLYRLPTMPNIF